MFMRHVSFIPCMKCAFNLGVQFSAPFFPARKSGRWSLEDEFSFLRYFSQRVATPVCGTCVCNDFTPQASWELSLGKNSSIYKQ